MSATSTPVLHLVQIRLREFLWKWVKYDENFIYIFIYTPFWGETPTRRQIFGLGG